MAGHTRRRWVMLLLGMAAQLSSCVFLYGLAFLVPVLRRDEGLALATAGTVVAAPTFGLLLTLVLWGAAADRYGERVVMATGLLLAGLALAAAAAVGTADITVLCVWLAVAGALGAAVNAASGRVVLGWFPPEQRGLAMGMRQMSQPLGMVAAALALPPLGAAHGFAAALVLPLGLCVLSGVAVAFLVQDPPRPPVAGGAKGNGSSPYRGATLPRLHAASALLVVPQFVVVSYAADFLTDVHGWSVTDAGRLLGAVQIAGALSRLLVGRWSDVSGLRLGPMRVLCAVNAVVVGVLALTAWPAVVDTSSPAVVLLVVACVTTVSWNGLAFTAVAELAGGAWAGRALGVQNTAQNLVAAVGPPFFGVLIQGPGYAVAYGLCAAVPVAAGALTPVGEEAARAGAKAGAVTAGSPRGGVAGGAGAAGAAVSGTSGAGPAPSGTAGDTGGGGRIGGVGEVGGVGEMGGATGR